ncbi:MAG: tetratricopeptide repeat protein [Planctomycetaceae bacterium]
MTAARQLVSTAVLALVVLPASANAVDVITVKGSSRRLSGKITSIGREKVVITSGLRMTKSVDVPVNTIVKINWDGEPRTLDGLRNTEAAGRYPAAIKGYAGLLKAGSGNANLVKDLKYFIARTTARIALRDPTKLDDAIAKLTDFDKRNINSYHHYELLSLLGEMQLAKKSYGDALTTYAKLAKAPWKDVRLSAKCAEARVLLAQGNSAQARDLYNAVLAETAKDATLKPLQSTANLGKAAALLKDGDEDGALTALAGVIRNTPATNTAVMAEAFLLQGDCHRKKGDGKDALLAYLRVDVLFAAETRFHPKALYYLTQLWAEVGKPLRAGDAKSRLTRTYPNSEWAKK